MWTILPSDGKPYSQEFFSLEQLEKLARQLHSRDQPPIAVIKGRIWAGEERSHNWSVECETFEGFCDATRSLAASVEFLAFDEMVLDEDTLLTLQDDLHRYCHDEGMAPDLVSKAVSALKSHENEMYAVLAYAFLSSGRVLFARAQNELARFVYNPQRLLSSDGLSSVRKLKTLGE